MKCPFNGSSKEFTIMTRCVNLIKYTRIIVTAYIPSLNDDLFPTNKVVVVETLGNRNFAYILQFN